jgi:hypothetical protein
MAPVPPLSFLVARQGRARRIRHPALISSAPISEPAFGLVLPSEAAAIFSVSVAAPDPAVAFAESIGRCSCLVGFCPSAGWIFGFLESRAGRG